MKLPFIAKFKPKSSNFLWDDVYLFIYVKNNDYEEAVEGIEISSELGYTPDQVLRCSIKDLEKIK